MKKVSYLFVFLISVITMSSCIESSESPDWGQDYATITEDYITMKKYFVLDGSGLKIYPTNFNLDASEITEDRAYVQFQLVNGEKFDETKKEYYAELISLTRMNTKRMLEIPESGSSADTLKNDPIIEIKSLYAYKQYLTVLAEISCDTYLYIDMVKDEISNDTLYLKYNINTESPSISNVFLNSFYIPRSYELEEITPKNDSIIIAIGASLSNYNGARYYNIKHKLE